MARDPKTRFIGLDLSLEDYAFLKEYARRDGNRPMTSVLRAVFQDWLFHQRLTEQRRQESWEQTRAAQGLPTGVDLHPANRPFPALIAPAHPEARENPDPPNDTQATSDGLDLIAASIELLTPQQKAELRAQLDRKNRP